MYKSGGEYHRHLGFANALRMAGNQFVFWNADQKPAFDIFDEYKPDVFIGTTFDLDRATINSIKNYPHMKVVLKGGNWGANDDKIDKAKYPIVFVSEKEKKLLGKLKAESGKPDLVICHYHPNRLEETMGGWRELGITPHAVMNAADVCVFNKGKYDAGLACDVSFVGGYWKYKAENLDKYIAPLCSPVGKVNIKIFGNQKWSVPQYLGGITDSRIKDLYTSSIVCPNVSEPHSNDFGWDVVERPFKIISSGGFLLMDTVTSAYEDVFGDSVDYYRDYKDLVNLIQHYKANPELRRFDAAYNIVVGQHTYHHRMADLLMKLDYPNEAAKVLAVLSNVL